MNIKIKEYFIDLWSLYNSKVALIIIIALIIYFKYCYGDNSNIDQNVIGFTIGFTVYVLQIIFDVKNMALNKIIKTSKLKRMLTHRNSKSYYENLLKSSKKSVDIMGVTAERFFQDFGSADMSEKGRIIDTLLHKNVKFRILLTDQNSNKAKRAKPFIEKYNKSENFQVRFFDENKYIPQSMFIVDQQCILGPMLTDINSKDTPALHFYEKNSNYTEEYITYFDKIWTVLN